MCNSNKIGRYFIYRMSEKEVSGFGRLCYEIHTGVAYIFVFSILSLNRYS